MSVATQAGKNYAVKVDGVNPRYYQQIFGRQLDDLKRINAFKLKAKSYHVGSKGKATLSAVRTWLKEQKPSQYFAVWTSDSSNYKDDCVEVWYLD
jgi:hypothetical protein